MTSFQANDMAKKLLACANCEKKTTTLKRCGGCKTVAYCHHECQKTHWKIHKKDCTTSTNSPSFNPDAKPFTAISNNIFLHNRSEEETFKILIEVIRMRQEDVYTLEGQIMAGTIYDGSNDSAPALRTFLRKAEQIPGFLPPWWTKAKAKECVQFGLREPRCLLKYCTEKSDVQENWHDKQMPMKLRMLGERVYGNTPGHAWAEFGSYAWIDDGYGG